MRFLLKDKKAARASTRATKMILAYFFFDSRHFNNSDFSTLNDTSLNYCEGATLLLSKVGKLHELEALY
jgi:hypothetical protein